VMSLDLCVARFCFSNNISRKGAKAQRRKGAKEQRGKRIASIVILAPLRLCGKCLVAAVLLR